MIEKTKVTEAIRIVVRDKKTGKIIRDEFNEIKPKRSFLDWVLGRESHATVLAKGWENIVRLLGNVGTGYYIDQIYCNIGNTMSTSNSVVVGDDSGATLIVSNSQSPWSTAGQYLWVKTTNSTSGDVFNSIKVDVQISSDQEWWVEEQWIFSQT